jgi:uncharacterized protein (DUF1919 family)
MKDLTKYNIKLALRINKLLRGIINQRNRKRLKNKDFSLLCNNCNGGTVSHDLGLQFRSPTVNLFFYNDHFFRFCENFDYYIAQPLVLCENPIHQPEIEYPVCNLGDLELHFLHYESFEQAKQKWDARTARINRDNIFVMWTFFDGTDERWLERFDKIPFENKVAFTEREFPQYKSAFCIHGFEEKDLGVLTLFDGLTGKRVIDQFDYVSWFNNGKKGK